MSEQDTVNLWSDAEHALWYLEKADGSAWREGGYGALFEWLPARPERVLDLGCGDGEVSARVRAAAPDSEITAADFSDEMLRRAHERFASDDDVNVVRHDLDEPLPGEWGTFDVIVSAFAIHHVVDDRKQSLYREIFEHLEPGGTFLNLEHVDSATPELHRDFLVTIGTDPDNDDPSNKLVAVETQLGWLREIGFTQVDCHYKWREIALLAGQRP